MSEEQARTLDYVARSVVATLRRRTSLPVEDIHQEAWAAMLAVVDSIDPNQNASGYLYRVALNACERFILKSACTVSASRRTQAKTIAESKAVSIDQATSLADSTPLADSALEARERTEALSLLLAEHLAAGEEGRAVMAVLSGESKSSQAAAEAGLEPTRLYYLTNRARRSIRADPRFRRFL